MGMSNRQRTIKVSDLLMRLAESLGTEIQPGRMRIYIEELKDIPVDKLVVALGVMKFKRFPSLFEIIDEAGCRPPTIQEEAEKAWLEIRGYKGQLSSMYLTGTALEVVKAMGGRGQYESCFGNWPASQEVSKRKVFISYYTEFTSNDANQLALTEK